MAAPKRRPAEIMYWKSPLEEVCTLQPLDRTGAIEVDVVEGEVLVHSRNVLLSVGTGTDADDQEYAELEFSVALDRCQINWRVVEKATVAEIERSIHFHQ